METILIYLKFATLEHALTIYGGVAMVGDLFSYLNKNIFKDLYIFRKVIAQINDLRPNGRKSGIKIDLNNYTEDNMYSVENRYSIHDVDRYIFELEKIDENKTLIKHYRIKEILDRLYFLKKLLSSTSNKNELDIKHTCWIIVHMVNQKSVSENLLKKRFKSFIKWLKKCSNIIF